MSRKTQFMKRSFNSCRKAIHFLTFSRKISVYLILQGESAAIPPAPLAAEPLRKMPSVALDEASFKRRSKKRTQRFVPLKIRKQQRKTDMRIFTLTDASPSLTAADFSPKGRILNMKISAVAEINIHYYLLSFIYYLKRFFGNPENLFNKLLLPKLKKFFKRYSESFGNIHKRIERACACGGFYSLHMVSAYITLFRKLLLCHTLCFSEI